MAVSTEPSPPSLLCDCPAGSKRRPQPHGRYCSTWCATDSTFRNSRPTFNAVGIGSHQSYFIEQRLDDPSLTVGELAAAVHVSEPYLRKLMKKTLNSGVIELIQRRRLERACHLLLETNLTLKEITARSGFASASLFHRLFRQRFGITPISYRDSTNPPPY